MQGHGSNSIESSEWQHVHGALMTIAKRRGALDAEEARLLRRAEACQIWREFGMVSPLDYLERKLGYTPHTANERLRVADALGELAELEHALETGELRYSAVRELTRVATEDSESAWIDWARDRPVHEVEKKVASHERGDHPGDPVKPAEARNHRVWLDLPPETYARWRQAMAILSDEHGRRLEVPAFVDALIDAALDQATDSEVGRARYSIAITVCERCRGAVQEGGGVQVPIGEAALACASCDAVEIGSIDGDGPGPATQTIPPAIRRFVMHRDGRRCRVPGCRSSKHLDLHHIVHREDGGQHDPELLIALCKSCHEAHHRGDLVISGTAKALEVVRPRDPDRRSHVGPNTNLRGDAFAALVTLGFSPAIARAALSKVPDPSSRPIEVVIREALRHCPRPS